MKLRFESAAALEAGIALVASELGFEVVNTGADVTVSVTEVARECVTVTLDEKKAEIVYGGGKARFFRGLATLCGWLKKGISTKTVSENPIFTFNGVMADVSRNAVLSVDGVKLMLRKMALIGLNAYMLYTEDTYEIEGRPYFGYMRGRYTKAELKELDAYAATLGIELIPCIQTLGHLNTHMRWRAAGAYKDTATVMLVGAEETYQLIEEMLKTCKECFTSRRIHLGLDETMDLGRGAYLKKNGFREGHEIYLEHLNRVCEMALSHGLKPMMWSDMFFRFAGKNIKGYYDYHPDVVMTDEIAALVPKGVQQVFWDYYRPSEEFYAVNIEKHKKHFSENVMFAGAVWLWDGFCPQFRRSLRSTYPALEACRKGGVREVLTTVWLSGGCQGQMMLSLAGLAWYASYDYKGERDDTDVRECFENACGVSYDDFMACELPEYPHDNYRGVSRFLFYNDPLLGLGDAHIKSIAPTYNYFADASARLREAAQDKGVFAPAFDVILKLSELFENKADFGIRLKAAYDAGDKAALSNLLAECDVIVEKLNALRVAHRKAWMTYYKPFGWENNDQRYGGMTARFDTVKMRLEAYLAGEIAHLEELEAERLRLDNDESAEPLGSIVNGTGYLTLCTGGVPN